MAAGNTYVALATQTLSSSAASVTFSSISGAYTDLIMICTGSVVSGGWVGLTLNFNGDTGSNYSSTSISGNGSTASSIREATAVYMNLGAIDSTVQTNNIFHIMNYANTTTYKTGLSRGNNSVANVRPVVGLWRSTAAITSIVISHPSISIATGATFTLYGIAAA